MVNLHQEAAGNRLRCGEEISRERRQMGSGESGILGQDTEKVYYVNMRREVGDDANDATQGL